MNRRRRFLPKCGLSLCVAGLLDSACMTPETADTPPETADTPTETADTPTTIPGNECNDGTTECGDFDVSYWDGQYHRAYHLHIPPSYSSSEPMPVVFLFHGMFDAWQWMRDFTGMPDLSDSHGFIAVYPEGEDETWNAGTCCGYASYAQVDDVTFTATMIEQLQGLYNIDSERIYAAGQMNGGEFALRLGCDRADQIAAVGSIDGTLAIDDCAPERPMPVWFLHGYMDYEGDETLQHTIAETLDVYMTSDACTTDPAHIDFFGGQIPCDDYQGSQGSGIRNCFADTVALDIWVQQVDNGVTDSSVAVSEDLILFFEAHPMP